MVQHISLPEFIRIAVNRISGSHFTLYSDYKEYREGLKNGTIKKSYTYVQEKLIAGGNLKGDDLETLKSTLLKNRLIQESTSQIITMGIKKPFPIYGDNGSPSVYKSDEVFQSEQMLEDILENEWARFGTIKLTVDLLCCEQSLTCFLNPILDLEGKNKEFNNSPLIMTVIRILEEGPERWKKYEAKDFDDLSTGSAVARILCQEYATGGLTAAQYLASHLKTVFYPKDPKKN